MPEPWTKLVGLGAVDAEAPPVSRGEAIRALMQDHSARFGAWTVLLVIVAAAAAPLVAAVVGHGPTEQFRQEALDASGIPVGPSFGFWLGADGEGRDVLVRTLYGAQISLLVGIPATTLAMVIGTVVGLTSGFMGGAFDRVTGQVIDVVLSFPFVVTALSLLALNRGGDGRPVISPVLVVIAIISAFSWTFFARLSRGMAVALRSQPFVDAAVTLAAGRRYILFREILPNVVPVIAVYWAVQLPTNIVAEATLSFLGVGIQAPTPSLGNMIADAQRTSIYQVQPWYLLGPAVALFVVVLGFNTFSSGLRNVLDPGKR
ncbi:ABC transporter permease [Rhodococcus aetherivorans]|jgi:peptide/nickel transport system permease protein|uniref:ABC transporter permease n=1 Tax=Rhodococcus aetherivorans TaxID=191292 RepID=A0AA46SF78_9NOCA|nr:MULTISPECIES: ABC transporter permease [Rhodococcus]NCL78340.1 Glutathione transport system permease protein GsiD [Rhodococcus sp. YH1]ANZ23978.1 peptide ABC transporter permease [Rhodococcus sp. WB1]PND53227.1 ABC transporter permease [Rhodococcus sp. ENV425]QRI78029.1 ABC transporter permease [Rhodococcus aetherivorans]QSE61445.1 ABC transporter permease [Rhodococcus sp. PSBB066]